jgi:hypothetical protein
MSEAFDSEVAKKMARALALAMERLGSGMLHDADETRSVLARAIIEAAEQGERDEEKLAVHAVEEFKKMHGGGSSGGSSIN